MTAHIDHINALTGTVAAPDVDTTGTLGLDWARLCTHLRAAEKSWPARFHIVDQWGARRSVTEWLDGSQHYRPTEGECWTILSGVIYQATPATLAAWANNRMGKLPGEARWTIRDRETQAPKADVIKFPAQPGTLADEGFVQSAKHAGLWQRVDRDALNVTFRFGVAEATYSILTGECVDASDRGSFPPATWAYIKERVAQLPAPHNRQPKEEEAAPARTTPVTLPPQKGDAPSVSEAQPAVNQKEDPMLDWSNPAVVASARATAMNVNKSINIADIDGRRRVLQEQNLRVEQEYRRAEVAAEEVRRRLAEIKNALKERAEELLLVAAEIKAEGTKAKYSTASALSTALKAALKTDSIYGALQTEIKGAEASLKTAANDDKPGIEAAISKKREALTAREVAINDASSAETVADTAPRYTTADAKSAAAIGLRKTDAEYLAIKAEVAKFEQALYQAETVLGDAKAAQRALAREWSMLEAEHRLASERVAVFGGLDFQPTVTTAPAAVA